MYRIPFLDRTFNLILIYVGVRATGLCPNQPVRLECFPFLSSKYKIFFEKKTFRQGFRVVPVVTV